ncbi:hypothetical protein PVA45_07185 (plasmid) [Entomospira entomophila]|uniref:Uncharacterized protein n=1 Tax=Entomospira entomophila TaxID=2719988 RepID=A0A968GA15_9SPIO|nr:hypothetical protein [Entomospira entomophilus]NIZ41358.1 hypothetical protein [Entomospira entomophilus]WDI36231.1 hypothetical protein PVA45_07185 [Entomospira entomophilus]
MGLIRIHNFVEDNADQSNSVELMASWQLWLRSNKPFIRLDSGSNSLRLGQGSYFCLSQPFRWYRIVNEDVIITQSQIDIGGNFKDGHVYYLYLIDDGEHGRFVISEDAEQPIGTQLHQVLQVARFRTQSGGVIEPNSIYDSQMQHYYEDHYPIGHTLIQYPHETSPKDRMPFLEWKEISQQYAGDFFRVAGGLASTFGSGRQSDSAPNITGTFGWVHGGQGAEGVFYDDRNLPSKDTASGVFSKHIPTSFNASRSSPAYGRRNEVAPQNQTIRIWIRES